MQREPRQPTGTAMVPLINQCSSEEWICVLGGRRSFYTYRNKRLPYLWVPEISLSTLWWFILYSWVVSSHVLVDKHSARPDRAVYLKRIVHLCRLSSLAYVAPFFLLLSLLNSSCLGLIELWPLYSPFRKTTRLCSNFLPQSCDLETPAISSSHVHSPWLLAFSRITVLPWYFFFLRSGNCC